MSEYPLIEVAVIVEHQEFLGEALPDTGYDGSVIVPAYLIGEELGIPEFTSLCMADNDSWEVETWDGRLLIEDRTFEVPAHAFGDQFIVGAGSWTGWKSASSSENASASASTATEARSNSNASCRAMIMKINWYEAQSAGEADDGRTSLRGTETARILALGRNAPPPERTFAAKTGHTC